MIFQVEFWIAFRRTFPRLNEIFSHLAAPATLLPMLSAPLDEIASLLVRKGVKVFHEVAQAIRFIAVRDFCGQGEVGDDLHGMKFSQLKAPTR